MLILNINFNFEENSPFEEGVMSEMFQRQPNHSFKNLENKGDLVSKGNFIHKYFPNKWTLIKYLN